MLKHLIAPMALAIACTLTLAPATAQAAPAPDKDVSGSHWYLGVGVGSGQSQSTTSSAYYPTPYAESTNGAAFSLFGGWRYANTRGDAFGIGITDTAISLDNSTAAGILGLDLNAKVHLVGAWFLSARVGAYTGRNVHVYDDAYYGYSYSYSDSQQGTFYGAGTGIDINASNALAISWDRYQVDDFDDTSYYPALHVRDVSLDVYMLSYTYTF